MSNTIATEPAPTSPVRVQNVRIGDAIDLESCPYLRNEPIAPYEYGRVERFEIETPDCVVIGYEGIDEVGYPINTVLRRSNTP